MKGGRQQQNQRQQDKKQARFISHQSESYDQDPQIDQILQQKSGPGDPDLIQAQSESVEAAVKTVKLRVKRGTKMEQLMKGNVKSDQFWDKHAEIFGGNLNEKEEEEDEEDYEESSSGRDEFDSDFNNTDSYPGKRGRKKGTKIPKRRRNGRGRGRPRKAKEIQSGQEDEDYNLSKPAKKQNQKQESAKRYKIIYKKVEEKKNDFFIIMKATMVAKRGRKPRKIQQNYQNKDENN